MEGAEKEVVDEELAIDYGVAEDNIRLKEKFNSNSIITSMRMKPTSKSRFRIPLCRMTSLPDVRPVLGPDVEKLIADFAHGYKEGDRVFYVSIHDGRGKIVPVTDEHRSSWNKHWIAENETFETMLQSDPDLISFSNHMFYVWDGNHRLHAWSKVIRERYNDERGRHISPECICLDPEGNIGQLIEAMLDINE
jgi:hypothetical protein